MSLQMHVITDADIPAVQAVYDARPDAFRNLIGRPALPDQAASDFIQALTAPGRYQFGITIGDTLIGLADLKLDDETEGLAQMGMLLLAPPYNDPDVAGLALRVVERWLAATFAVRRIEAGVPAHVPADLGFWQGQGYRLTGGQFRRDLPGYSPRLLILAKDLAS